MLDIHPTAVVSPEASIGEGVEIGPYSVIGPQVRIGAGSILMSHVHMTGDTRIGENCRLYPGVSIGTPAQVTKRPDVRSKVIIGAENVLREYVTINRSMSEGGTTVLGDRNYLMTGAHVGHDCVIGNDVVMANSAALGGHVVVEDRAMIGGLVGVHQFARIGRLTIIGGCSKVAMDAAPFSIYSGSPARFCGLNAIGLRRAGYSSSRMTEIKRALKTLFHGRSNFANSIPEIRREFKDNPDVQTLIEFIERSKRGIARASDVE